MMGGLLPAPGSVPRAPSRLAFLLAAIAGPLILMLLVVQIGGRLHSFAVLRMLNQDAYEQRVNAAELISSFAEAESAQRGYIITGDEEFLGSYDAARLQVDADLARSARFDLGDDHAARITRLRTLIDARMREMALVIDLRRGGGFAAAAARIGTNHSLALSRSAEATAAQFSKAESDAIADRIARLRARYFVFEKMLWAVTLLLGALASIALWLLWRARKRHFELECNAHDTAARLFAMFVGNADATLLLDTEGCIEAINPAAKSLLGYAADELLGRDIVALFDVEDRRDFRERVGIEDGRLTRPYWLDRTIRHADGHAVPVDIAVGALDLPDGLRVLMTMRDIAERKTVERLKDEFLATVSHELRTPLTSVIGALGLLRKGAAGRLPDAADRLVEIAENNARRLIRLVNDLLDIERIGSGCMHFDRFPTDLQAAAEIALADARGLAEGRGVTLQLHAADTSPIVLGDRDRLIQVLANLLSNAVRFSPEGGRVRVALSMQEAEAVVTVDDEGPGIPPEFNGRIFERFAQAPDTPVGGSGLGLAISREIVVAHDGRISFGRAPGPRGGARFTVALPLVQPITPAPSIHARVLVGEGDADVARSLCEMLEGDGFAVDIVASDHEALAAARSGRHDALLLDIALPESGGIEVVRALRRQPETRSLPAIIVAPERASDSADGAALDLVDWLDKPVDATRLTAAMRRAIEHSMQARPTLLHIDDDVDMIEVAAAVLAEHGRIIHATSLASARALLAVRAPDLVILDLTLPDGSGAALLPELMRADGMAIPTIIYSARDVMPDLERQVDAVLVKSRRSLDSLARAVDRLLSSGA